MSADFEVGPGVLVPRAETELLGRTALELIEQRPEPLVIDMCCGSGNVGLGILAQRRDIRLYGADLTPEAIGWARRNAERLDPGGRSIYAQGDLFAALDAYDLAGRADIVAANPPYISSHKLETDSAYLLDSEPREAFDAGPYGIAIHQRLIAEAPTYLVAGGWLAFEFGAGQERQVKALFSRSRAYRELSFRTDANGVPRVAIAQTL
jgi:release factor glutamine methyltransferase